MVKHSLPQTDNQIDTLPEGYKDILASIISKIKDAQARALKAVNQELIEVYRDIGRTIHEKQEQREWGDSVVERLAKDLQNGFPGIKGFSSRNLWRMRDLYKSYQGNEKLTTLSSEISWSHNVALLSKCKDATKPINIASYHMVKTLPQELKDQLPSPEQIALLLDHMS